MKNQKGKFRSIQDQYWSHPTKTAKKKSQVKSWKEFYGSDKDLNESLFDHCKEKDEGQVDSYYHLMNNGDSYFASSKIQIKLYYPYHYLESFQNDPNQYVIEMEDRLKLIEFDNFIVKDLGFKDLISSEGYPGFPIYYFVEKNIDVLKVPDLVRSIIDKHKELLGNDDLPYTTLTTDNLCLDCLFRQEVDSYSSTTFALNAGRNYSK